MLFKLQKAVWHASLQTRHKRLSVNEEQMRRDSTLPGHRQQPRDIEKMLRQEDLPRLPRNILSFW
jgi:hypothetical protein